MLPFPSGRARSWGASALLSAVILSCVTLAGEPTPRATADGKAKPKERPKPEEGLTDIPITSGYDAKGLVLPDFDRQGRLRGKLEAGITRRLDEERVEFKEVKFTTFSPETETPELEIVMSSSVFNLKTQVLDSSERTTVKRSDFEIAGDTMQFEMLTRKGVLDGNVRMVVHGKTHGPEQADE